MENNNNNNNTQETILVDAEDFIYHMLSTSDYTADSIELFATNQFENMKTLEQNVDKFIQWID